jgi:hypothetical protein
MAQAIGLARKDKDRELLALAGQFGKKFLDQLAAEQHSRLDGPLESAQMAVDDTREVGRGTRAAHEPILSTWVEL